MPQTRHGRRSVKDISVCVGKRAASLGPSSKFRGLCSICLILFAAWLFGIAIGFDLGRRSLADDDDDDDADDDDDDSDDDDADDDLDDDENYEDEDDDDEHDDDYDNIDDDDADDHDDE
eukprot:12407026-Karenia_brevis.AAC.1